MAGADGERQERRRSPTSATCSTSSASATPRSACSRRPAAVPRRMRVEARVIDDPIARSCSRRWRSTAGCNDADVQVPERRRAARSRSPRSRASRRPSDGVTKARRTGSARRTRQVKVDGRRRHGHGRRSCPPSQVQSVAAALAKYAGAQNVNDVSITTVGPTWGHEVSQKALKALIIFFFVLAAVPRDPVRVEDVGGRDRRGDPRHHLHGRRLRAVPFPGVARDGHRVPDDPRFLALRHRRRVRQGQRVPTHAHRDRAARPTARW